MTAMTPVSPVVTQHQQRDAESPPLKTLAVWCGITTAWVALVTAIAHATAAGKGLHYVSMLLAVTCIAPFMFVGFGLVWKHARPMIAAAFLVMVGATTLATMVGAFDGSAATGVASVTFGSFLIIASAFGTLIVLHDLGDRARGSLRFLVVELAAIVLVIWSGGIAPALLASVVYWVMYRTAPKLPRPYQMHHLE